MTRYLHTMVRITDPAKSRAFYEALGLEFRREMDIVRNGEREATNWGFIAGSSFANERLRERRRLFASTARLGGSIAASGCTLPTRCSYAQHRWQVAAVKVDSDLRPIGTGYSP